MNDLLVALPPEIVLQIIDLVPLSTTAQLTRVSKAWHSFIDTTHQDRVYSHPSKVDRPINTRDFSFLTDQNCFTHDYYHGVNSWKDLCKRQVLLRKNITSETPVTRESIYQVDLSQVWRFRPDFKRRFIISTSELGGVSVTDMDSGEELWCEETVREFAHLEYDMETGTAAWDAIGDIVEVWRVDETQRGVFNRIEVLEHDCQTRGFQIGYGNLSVVSSEGKGFVYDFHPTVKLKKEIRIEQGAIGHLCQDREVVMFSMGQKGYHVHTKETGRLLGVIDPSRCSNIDHINHDQISHLQQDSPRIAGPPVPPFPPGGPSIDRVALNKLESGPHPDRENGPLDEDDWGAGLLDGDVMAGVSRRGRVFICNNWRQVLSALPGKYDACSSIIECETIPVAFDLGGWLSLRHGKISIEVDDCIYIMSTTSEDKSPIWAIRTGSSSRSRAPVSFMAVWDDCFMYTYVVSSSPLMVMNNLESGYIDLSFSLFLLLFLPDALPYPWTEHEYNDSGENYSSAIVCA